MTYRSSYFKLCMEEMKRRLVIIIITLALFFGYIVSFVFSLLSQFMYADEIIYEEMQASIADMCSPSGMECVLGMLMGVFLAAQGFAYLHSKRKMDFYGALPISRAKRFGVLCTTQVSLFTIPLLLTEVAKILIVMVSGFGTRQAYLNIIYSTICVWVSFLALWAITVFAVIITGNLALSLAGVALISSYMPLCRFVIFEGCCNLLLDTYVSREPTDFWYLFSPFTVLAKAMPDFGEAWSWREYGIWIPVFLIYAAVFGVVSYVLFLKRQNETAGKAMAFPKGNRLVQIMLVIPYGILCGLVTSVWVTWINVWLIIPAVIFGCCFAHMLLECIFHYNIRKVFIHKWQMIVTTAVTVGMILFIGLDIIGYDSYLPEANEVRAIYVSTNQGETMPDVEDIDVEVTMSDGLKNDIISSLVPMLEEQEWQPADVTEGILLEGYHRSVDVVFVTANGQIKQRSYSLPESYDFSGTTKYYDTREYREIVSESKWKCLDTMISAEWCDLASSETLKLTEEEMQELFRIYREEYYSTSIGSVALGEISLYSYEHYESFYVYENCKETIAYLESKGVAVFTIDDCEFTKLEIFRYDEGWENAEEVIITDKAVIEKYQDRFMLNYYSGKAVYYDIYANVSEYKEIGQVPLIVSEEVLEELMANGTK